jgi:hypothetical protein
MSARLAAALTSFVEISDEPKLCHSIGRLAGKALQPWHCQSDPFSDECHEDRLLRHMPAKTSDFVYSA